jgi:hypothetical protein
MTGAFQPYIATMFRSYRIATVLSGVGCAVIVGMLVTDYTINHFYKTGAYFWDSGLYTYYMSFSYGWPLRHHPAYALDVGAPGGSFFEEHFQPIFYLATALYRFLPVVPPAAYFCLLQGIWFGALTASCFVFFVDRLYTTPRLLVMASLIAIMTSLNGPVLAWVGFPHVETAIPALFFAFLAARALSRPRAAFVLLALALSIREDAGLHIGSMLALLGIAQWVSRTAQEQIRANLVAAFSCIGYAVLVLIAQYIFYNGEVSHLSHIYLGTPPFHHLNSDMIWSRTHIFLTDKAYAIWPILLLLAVSALKRDIILSVAPIAVLPWLLISLLAVSDSAGTLVSYYSFPTIISIAWPGACHFLSRDRSPSSWWEAAGLQVTTSALSIVLFVLLGAGNHDNAPWRGLSIPPVKAIGSDEATLRQVIGQRAKLGGLIVDDSVLSLVPEVVGKHEWVLKWTSDRSSTPPGSVPCPDVVIYQPGAYDGGNTMQVIRECGLARSYRLSDTPFVLSSHRHVGIGDVTPLVRAD